MNEWSLIERYFSAPSAPHKHVALGIGDDAALLTVPPDQALVVSVDTLVEGVHFWPEVDPEDLGHKALAVSLSDMAAMGARPFSALLSQTLPELEPDWLAAFSKGFFSLGNAHKVSLAGGDTSAGPLSVTTVVHGFVPKHQAMKRSGARVGDLLCVTGVLGAAGLALRDKDHPLSPAIKAALHRPTPRVEFALALRHFATAAVDISDGLLLDASQMTAASGVGAQVWADELPTPNELWAYCTRAQALELALSAGDDYELCFTVPRDRMPAVKALSREHGLPVSVVGSIVPGSRVRVIDSEGCEIALKRQGFSHFDESVLS